MNFVLEVHNVPPEWTWRQLKHLCSLFVNEIDMMFVNITRSHGYFPIGLVQVTNQYTLMELWTQLNNYNANGFVLQCALPPMMMYGGPPQVPAPAAPAPQSLLTAPPQQNLAQVQFSRHNYKQILDIQPPIVKVYIGNLPFDTTHFQLQQLLNKFGVGGFKMVKNDEGVFRGFVLVDLEPSLGVNLINSLNGEIFNGRVLIARYDRFFNASVQNNDLNFSNFSKFDTIVSNDGNENSKSLQNQEVSTDGKENDDQHDEEEETHRARTLIDSIRTDLG